MPWTMEPIARLEASKRHASGLAFSPDGRTLATGGMEGALRVWRVKDWTLSEEVPGHKASVNSIDATGTGWVTAGSDKTLRVWKKDWQAVETIPGYVACAPVHGALVARKDRGDRLYRHDLKEGKATAAAATGLDRLHGPWSTPAGVAVAGMSPVVQLRDPDDLGLLAALDGHGVAATSVSCTYDGRTLAVADASGRLHLWDLQDRARVANVPLGRKGYFFAAISPDGRLVATAGEGVVGLFTVAGEPVWTNEPGIKGLYGLAWSPNGRHLANAASDGKVRVWKV